MENQEMFELEDNIIELIDEEGNAVNFELVASVEHEGDTYIMVVEESVIEAAEDDGELEMEAMVLKVELEGDEEIYVPIEDDDLATIVFEKCLAVLDEEFEDEE